MKKNYVLNGLLGIFMFGLVNAAPVIAGELSLQECVDVAIGQNPILATAQGRTQTSQINVNIARSAFAPTVMIQASGNRNKTPMFLPSEFKALSGKTTFSETKNVYLTQANASLTIADGGLRKSKLQVAESGVDVSKEEEKGIKQQLVLKVHEAFYLLAAAIQNQEVANRNLSRSKSHLEMAESRHSVGDVALVDVLRAKVQVADAKLLLVRVENSVALAKGTLNVAMGNMPDNPVEIIKVLEETPAHETLNYTALTASATVIHPTIKAMQERIVLARKKVNQYRAANKPTLNAVGAYGKQDLDFFPEKDNWAVGLEASWVAFDGGARREQIKKAMAELSVNATELQTSILNLQMEIWAALQAVIEASCSNEAAKDLAREAEESLRIIQVRYKAGSGTITDLLDAQTAQSKADFSVVETNIQKHIAYSRLLYTCGRLG